MPSRTLLSAADFTSLSFRPLHGHLAGKPADFWFRSNLTAGGARIETVVESSVQALLFCMQGEDAIEDWEIWGDPREIERRKAERARAATPPEQRKQQVDSGFR